MTGCQTCKSSPALSWGFPQGQAAARKGQAVEMWTEDGGKLCPDRKADRNLRTTRGPGKGVTKERPTFRPGRASVPEHLVDTGPLVGWINSRDQWHDSSVKAMEGLGRPHHLRGRDRRGGREAESPGMRSTSFTGWSRPERLGSSISAGTYPLRALAAKYPEMDLDAAMVRLAEMFPKAKVVTTDSGHFTSLPEVWDKPLDLVRPAHIGSPVRWVRLSTIPRSE